MPQLQCIVCHHPFDVAYDETAIVLRPEFSRDPRRARVLDVAPLDGWAAVLPETPRRFATGELWVLLEHRDTSRHVEGLVRDR